DAVQKGARRDAESFAAAQSSAEHRFCSASTDQPVGNGRACDRATPSALYRPPDGRRLLHPRNQLATFGGCRRAYGGGWSLYPLVTRQLECQPGRLVVLLCDLLAGVTSRRDHYRRPWSSARRTFRARTPVAATDGARDGASAGLGRLGRRVVLTCVRRWVRVVVATASELPVYPRRNTHIRRGDSGRRCGAAGGNVLSRVPSDQTRASMASSNPWVATRARAGLARYQPGVRAWTPGYHPSRGAPGRVFSFVGVRLVTQPHRWHRRQRHLSCLV